MTDFVKITSTLETGAPYFAEPVGPCGLWAVVNKSGLNIACAADGSGTTLMDEPSAKQYAEQWNNV